LGTAGLDEFMSGRLPLATTNFADIAHIGR
jgi:hypothetical protein